MTTDLMLVHCRSLELQLVIGYEAIGWYPTAFFFW